MVRPCGMARVIARPIVRYFYFLLFDINRPALNLSFSLFLSLLYSDNTGYVPTSLKPFRWSLQFFPTIYFTSCYLHLSLHRPGLLCFTLPASRLLFEGFRGMLCEHVKKERDNMDRILRPASLRKPNYDSGSEPFCSNSDISPSLKLT